MFVTLLYDVILDVQLPPRSLLTETHTHTGQVRPTGPPPHLWTHVGRGIYLLGLNMLDSWKQCVASG